MENVTPHATRDAKAAMRRKIAELKERPGWAHHVADAATGKLLTTKLRQPVTPLSRAKRLAQLGHQFDPSIFGTPTYRLTPRYPYQASPLGYLWFDWAREVMATGDGPDGYAWWYVAEDIPDDRVGGVTAVLHEPPQGRYLLTLHLGTWNLPGQVGRIRIEVRSYAGSEPVLIASFGLAAHGDSWMWNTFDLGFMSVPFPEHSLFVEMILESGSGLQIVEFTWLTLAPQRPRDIGL